MADGDTNTLNYEGLELYDAAIKNHCEEGITHFSTKKTLTINTENLPNNYKASENNIEVAAGEVVHSTYKTDGRYRGTVSLNNETNQYDCEITLWNGSEYVDVCTLYSITPMAHGSDSYASGGDPEYGEIRYVRQGDLNDYNFARDHWVDDIQHLYIGFENTEYGVNDQYLWVPEVYDGSSDYYGKVYYIALWSNFPTVTNNEIVYTLDKGGNATYKGEVTDGKGHTISDAYNKSYAMSELKDVQYRETTPQYLNGDILMYQAGYYDNNNDRWVDVNKWVTTDLGLPSAETGQVLRASVWDNWGIEYRGMYFSDDNSHLIAPVEKTDEASQSYAVGKYFILRGEVLCKVIAAIDQGDTLVENTNYEEVDNVFDELSGGGGGTTVVANPSGTASTNLIKLQVGSSIYAIPSGSGTDVGTRVTIIAPSDGAGYYKIYEDNIGQDTIVATINGICGGTLTAKKNFSIYYDFTSGKICGTVSDYNVSNVDIVVTEDSNDITRIYIQFTQVWELFDAIIYTNSGTVTTNPTRELSVTGTVKSKLSDLTSTSTDVIANPSGTASTDLTKLQVGQTIYGIPSGGGSSFPDYNDTTDILEATN